MQSIISNIDKASIRPTNDAFYWYACHIFYVHGKLGYFSARRKCLLYGRVHTRNFTRRANRSRTVRVGLPVYTLRPLRRVRQVHSDHIRRSLQWTRTVRVGLALQFEGSSGRVVYGSDAPSAHVCRLTYFFPLH